MKLSGLVTVEAGTAEVTGLDGGGGASSRQANAAAAAARASSLVAESPKSCTGKPLSRDTLDRAISALNCAMRLSFSAARSSSDMWTPFCCDHMPVGFTYGAESTSVGSKSDGASTSFAMARVRD